MNSLKVVALTVSSLIFACASAEQLNVMQYITAPGGKVTYYIASLPAHDADSSPLTAIISRENDKNKLLLAESPSEEPENNLTYFSNLHLSPDAKYLYFDSSAWSTSDAVHSLSISTGKVKYVSPGELACVVLSGEYQGDLVVEKHKYFVQGGSHDDLYLVDLNGKEIGLVAEGTDASGVCPELGQ